MKNFLSLCAALLCAGMFGCAKSGTETAYVRIVPAFGTRVSGLHFDTGDRIGLTVARTSGVYAENQMMTYDGEAFAGDLLWYSELQEAATLTAYYPYLSSGEPAEFSVAADQRDGCAASDLLGAVKRDVLPGTAPVSMLFYHLMAQLTVVIDNNSSTHVTGVTLGGFIPTAEVDFEALAATAKSGVAAANIEAFEAEAGLSYRAILVPQSAALTVTVTAADGLPRTKTLSAVELSGGRRYSLAVDVSDEELALKLSGEISDWVDGGPIGGSSGDSEGATLDYGGVAYRTVKIGDRVWMADNLRYMPADCQLGDGVWNPAAGESAVEEQGLLYDRAAALGGAVRSATGEVVRGICPEGWHVPDEAELTQLVEASCGAEFFVCAGYWISSTGKYSTGTRGALLGATLAESESVGLGYESPLCTPALKSYPADYGLSLRCVKDL